jgi:hypothetical protein
VLAVGSLGLLEWHWRSQGHIASVHDNADLWAFQRDRVEGAGRDTLALLGASRMQFGFHLDVFREECPGVEPVQLAVFAKKPYATLRDLASDESFAGLVLCSLDEVAAVPAWEGQEDFVAYHGGRWGPGFKASLVLAAPVQRLLALSQPQLSGRPLLTGLLDGRQPQITYIETRFDRTAIAHYDKLGPQDIKAQIRHRIRRTQSRLGDEEPIARSTWDEMAAAYADCVRAIRSRGGDVVFVKFPMRGQFRVLSERYAPRAEYWDGLAAATGAETIHFEDMPGHERLVLPDASHLDATGGIAFTRWVARELVRRGVIPPAR